MKMNELFPSKYLRSSDLGGKSRIAIVDRVTYEAFQNDGRTETKAVLHFKGERHQAARGEQNKLSRHGVFGRL